MPAVVILLRDPACCFASWDNVLIEIWRFAPAPHLVSEKNRIAREFIAKCPARVCSVSIIEPTSPPPNDRARAELAKFSSEIVPQMALAIIVAEGGGFRAALIRGVGITLTALMPHRIPFKFVTDVAEAVALIVPHLSTAPGGARGLQHAVEEVRRQLSPGAPADVWLRARR